MGEQREGNVPRQERVRQRIAALVLECGANECLASLARQVAERSSSAARVRFERGELRAPLRAWIRRQLPDSSRAVPVVCFGARMIAVHPPLELGHGARYTAGAKLGGQHCVAEGFDGCRVRRPL